MARFKWAIICGVVFLFLLSPVLVSAEGEIKFGLSSPLSSGDYKSGQLNVQAAELFIDEINAKGGLLGKKVALVKADDEGKPAVGVTAMQRLVGQNVSAIVG
ncbi:MAG: ABC transporter substrate-binding protein, partial [Deltaproteobacteria bacterium]|nr:ABC transporter substrate-binding protein [Deltaproteobacteria bacterium]